ncbi:DDE-type integrase/transposase/recombinase [Ottowia oryzae]|uniref:Transposase n=1 Tax=Ottowia oryzae TaxID=2109914 RepID=A0A2S0MAW8_9BURK|nr:DDE-type integrase/transposase/recombinase [Ottowia oryzae]AVO33029.1 transposase [Ottowia oryzae]
MPAALPPDELVQLCALRDRLAAAAHGEATALKTAYLADKTDSLATLHRKLRVYAGYRPERKVRSDKGRTRLPADTLDFIASTRLASQRQNAHGHATKPIGVAMNVAEQNGFEVNVTPGRVASLLRSRQMDMKTQANARNHLRLRSLFPNHVHQIDPSLCLMYYMGGRQVIMNEARFNKNKPVAMERVKLKVWRYTRYDHASRCIDVRYYEAAGENQASLFDFLMHTWGAFEGRLSHGVPQMLLWDKGSANTSTGVRRLLDALGVNHETHAAHHAWVKGGVESANYIVERQFESRLRAEPVTTVEQLNAAAAAWVRDYNANAIAHVDARVRCDDGEQRVRDDLWSLILQTPGALVELPARDVCAWFMTGKEHTRMVRDSRITFVHPQSGRSELYDLTPWAGEIYNGQKLDLVPLLMADCALRVMLPSADGSDRFIEVEPVREFDAYGRPLSAPVIGLERRQAPHTAAQEVAKRLTEVTWGAGTSTAEAEKLRDKNARPFAHLNDGKGAVAHSHLGKTELPARLLPDAEQVQTAAIAGRRAAEKVAPLLNHFQATRALKERGVAMNPERVSQLRAWYPDGVPENELDNLQHRLTVRAGLRVVGGGGATE